MNAIERKPYGLDMSKPWEAPAPLFEQLKPGSMIGVGYLLRTTTNDLQRILFETTEKRNGFDLIQKAADLMKKLCKDQTRKDRKTPYANHLYRVAIRFAQDKRMTGVPVAIALLHDAEEDHGLTKKDIRRALQTDTEETELIYTGIHALNKYDEDKRLTSDEYHEKIDRASRKHPELFLWGIKPEDRVDSFRGDLANVLEGEKTIGDLLPPLKKVESIQPHVERYGEWYEEKFGRAPIIIADLTDAVALAKSLIIHPSASSSTVRELK